MLSDEGWRSSLVLVWGYFRPRAYSLSSVPAAPLDTTAIRINRAFYIEPQLGNIPRGEIGVVVFEDDAEKEYFYDATEGDSDDGLGYWSR